MFFEVPVQCCIMLYFTSIAFVAAINASLDQCPVSAAFGVVGSLLGTAIMFHHYHVHSRRGDWRYMGDEDDRWFDVDELRECEGATHAYAVLVCVFVCGFANLLCL